ncbi:MAG: twin-arginine translocase TatA/TatE family subunit [Anaerolineae bacterium]|nr:twin-arginine translocase TatA/TatE family subunit [Anaerolineae bacterium]
MNIFSNIGITELIVILLLALLVVGPERLPEMARQLAKLLRDLRTAYENLTKDLGPEIMSLEKTTREIRESVNSVRSIPKDMVGSVVKAAELEDTIAELKDVQKSVEQTGRSVTQAGELLRKPLDETLRTARGALDPAKTEGQADAQLPAPQGEDEPGQPAPEPGEGRPSQESLLGTEQGRVETGSPDEPTSPASVDEEAGQGPPSGAAEEEQISE